MERVVSGLKSLIEGPLAGSDRAEELNGRGLEANRHGDTSAALGLFLEAHVRGGLDEPVPNPSLIPGASADPELSVLSLNPCLTSPQVAAAA
eukprot:scaffold127900_cov63-Phaeocystis_antarctica.AAC.2